MRETALYAPVKTMLEAQGFEVKAEIGAVDLMALRDDEPPVVVELKTSFSLSLFHQAVDRQSITDAVYIAVPRGRGRAWQRSLKANGGLCRRLGLGLITVDVERNEALALIDPTPYRPRINNRRKTRLLREFSRRDGDPNLGGAPANAGRMTAYRQDAIRLAHHLGEHGPSRGAAVAAATGVTLATRIMADNHYGWFERITRGVYGLTEHGVAGLDNAASKET